MVIQKTAPTFRDGFGLFLSFYVLGVFSAPFAVFFKLQFLLDGLFVFSGSIINPLTNGTF
jgi:hypothetical protein